MYVYSKQTLMKQKRTSVSVCCLMTVMLADNIHANVFNSLFEL